MIDRTRALPVLQRARLVGIARSSVYYRAQPVSEAGQLLMRRIDELHLEFPFSGARMLAGLLRRDGHAIGRRHVRTLMKRIPSRRCTAGRIRADAMRGCRASNKMRTTSVRSPTRNPA
ncbi:hypothetical protein HDG42_007882 [Paraburkholderia sp. JPY171]|nr:hypothetical protein [Paraburkholderia atlantica]